MRFMPGFFKERPNPFWEKGKWQAITFRFYFNRHAEMNHGVYKYAGTAYLAVRIFALLRDYATLGEEAGVGWSLKNLAKGGCSNE